MAPEVAPALEESRHWEEMQALIGQGQSQLHLWAIVDKLAQYLNVQDVKQSPDTRSAICTKRLDTSHQAA